MWKVFAVINWLLILNSLEIQLTKGDGDGDKYEYSGSGSNNNDQKELDNDFGVHVYQSNGVPSLRFYSTLDTKQIVYCFEFKKSFETYYYNNDGNYSKIGNSEIDFNSLDWQYLNGDNTSNYDFAIYAVRTYGDNNEKLTKADSIRFESKFSNGSEIYFSINITNYNWNQNANKNSKYVMLLDLKDCSSEYHYDDKDDDHNDTNIDSDGSGSGSGKRKLSDGKNETDEHDEEFENEHKNYDLSAAFFEISNQAIGHPNNDTIAETIYAYLYTKSNGEDDGLHIVFDYFGHSLYQDPVVGVDDTKVSSASLISLISNVFITLSICFFYYV